MSNETKIVKQKLHCDGCDNTFVLAYPTQTSETPTYCPFCGEMLDEDEDED